LRYPSASFVPVQDNNCENFYENGVIYSNLVKVIFGVKINLDKVSYSTTPPFNDSIIPV